MKGIQTQIETSLGAIQGKMSIIEQKMFATQKHLDSFSRTRDSQPTTPTSPVTRAVNVPKPSVVPDETIATMLKTLKKQ